MVVINRIHTVSRVNISLHTGPQKPVNDLIYEQHKVGYIADITLRWNSDPNDKYLAHCQCNYTEPRRNCFTAEPYRHDVCSGPDYHPSGKFSHSSTCNNVEEGYEYTCFVEQLSGDGSCVIWTSEKTKIQTSMYVW